MIAPRSRSALLAILLALAFTPTLAAQVDTNQDEANPAAKASAICSITSTWPEPKEPANFNH
jgi:hypothetical protein